MASTNNQNNALKELPVNNETMKASDVTEPTVQDWPVIQIGKCFQNFGDTLSQHNHTWQSNL